MMSKHHNSLLCYMLKSRKKASISLCILSTHLKRSFFRPKSIHIKYNSHQTQKNSPLGSRPADGLQDVTWLSTGLTAGVRWGVFFAKWKTHSAKSSLTKIMHCQQECENIYKILCIQRHLHPETSLYVVQHNTEQEQHCLQQRMQVANVLLNLDPDGSIIKRALPTHFPEQCMSMKTVQPQSYKVKWIKSDSSTLKKPQTIFKKILLITALRPF